MFDPNFGRLQAAFVPHPVSSFGTWDSHSIPIHHIPRDAVKSLSGGTFYVARIPKNSSRFVGCLREDGSFIHLHRHVDKVEVLRDSGNQAKWIGISQHASRVPTNAYLIKNYFDDGVKVYVGSCQHGIGMVSYENSNWRYTHVYQGKNAECTLSSYYILCIDI